MDDARGGSVKWVEETGLEFVVGVIAGIVAVLLGDRRNRGR